MQRMKVLNGKFCNTKDFSKMVFKVGGTHKIKIYHYYKRWRLTMNGFKMCNENLKNGLFPDSRIA